MSGDSFQIKEQNDIYFLTFTIVQWVDLFSRDIYKQIIVESLNYCVAHKNLEIYSWIIMSNHLHLVCRVSKPNRLSDVIRDFKKFTSRKCLDAVFLENESRRNWMIKIFSREGDKNRANKFYKLWKKDNHAIWVQDIDIWDIIEYIHDNPVRAGIVRNQSDYIYSSAIDYCGKAGLVKINKIE